MFHASAKQSLSVLKKTVYLPNLELVGVLLYWYRQELLLPLSLKQLTSSTTAIFQDGFLLGGAKCIFLLYYPAMKLIIAS